MTTQREGFLLLDAILADIAAQAVDNIGTAGGPEALPLPTPPIVQRALDAGAVKVASAALRHAVDGWGVAPAPAASCCCSGSSLSSPPASGSGEEAPGAAPAAEQQEAREAAAPQLARYAGRVLLKVVSRLPVAAARAATAVAVSRGALEAFVDVLKCANDYSAAAEEAAAAAVPQASSQQHQQQQPPVAAEEAMPPPLVRTKACALMGVTLLLGGWNNFFGLDAAFDAVGALGDAGTSHTAGLLSGNVPATTRPVTPEMSASVRLAADLTDELDLRCARACGRGFILEMSRSLAADGATRMIVSEALNALFCCQRIGLANMGFLIHFGPVPSFLPAGRRRQRPPTLAAALAARGRRRQPSVQVLAGVDEPEDEITMLRLADLCSAAGLEPQLQAADAVHFGGAVAAGMAHSTPVMASGRIIMVGGVPFFEPPIDDTTFFEGDGMLSRLSILSQFVSMGSRLCDMEADESAAAQRHHGGSGGRAGRGDGGGGGPVAPSPSSGGGSSGSFPAGFFPPAAATSSSAAGGGGLSSFTTGGVQLPHGAQGLSSCANCGALQSVNVKLKRCGGCKEVKYCSTACQAAAWKAGHKTECKQ